MDTLQDTNQVIKALGGRSQVASLTNRTTQAVTNWKARQVFPPDTFVILTEALAEKGLKAPVSLWRMSEAA